MLNLMQKKLLVENLFSYEIYNFIDMSEVCDIRIENTENGLTEYILLDKNNNIIEVLID